MRIVTWNMDSWKHSKKRDEAWAFLLHEHIAGIALVCLHAIIGGDVQVVGTDLVAGRGGVSLSPGYSVRSVWSPAYSGKIRISEDMNPRLRPLDSP